MDASDGAEIAQPHARNGGQVVRAIRGVAPGNVEIFSAVPRSSPRAPAASLRAQNILEIFLYGGVSQYESFYCVDAFGQSDSSGWWTFFNNGEVQKAVAQCGYAGPLLQDFAKDSDGNQVKFGPFVMPLRDRPDVMDRVRVAVTRHDLEPHEGAIPLALAGGISRPRSTRGLISSPRTASAASPSPTTSLGPRCSATSSRG